MELKEEIFKLIGEASMCWEPIPTGVFDSSKAIQIGNQIMFLLEKELKDKGAIY